MFQFRRFPAYAYLIQRRLLEYCSSGFPHSEIPGSMPMCGSPRLIAACHVLHRLLMPRHSPCALISLTSSGQAPYPSLPAKAESSLIPLPLLSGSNPLRWALSRFLRARSALYVACSYGPLFKWSSRIMQASEFTANCLLPISFKMCFHNCSSLLLALPFWNHHIHIVQFSRCALQPFLRSDFSIQLLLKLGTEIRSYPGGPKWTRTTDLTIISRVL